MNHTPDTAAGHDPGFDPRQAAALLDQTTTAARRQFQPSPPWLLATRAVAVLAALGAVWLNVRTQHPYTGPTATVIPVLIAFIVLNFAATVGVRRRATTGIAGRSRFTPVEITVLVAAFAAAVIAMTALGAAGVAFAWYPTSVLVIPALAWTALMATRGDWRRLAIGPALVLIGIAGAAAGPAGSWAVAAVGLCALLAGMAAATAWSRHA